MYVGKIDVLVAEKIFPWNLFCKNVLEEVVKSTKMTHIKDILCKYGLYMSQYLHPC